MSPPGLRDLDVIAPNLKRRLSGVTATVVRLLPIQAERIAIAATGPGLPPGIPHVPLWKLPFLPRDRWRVWHARRNTEMLLGLFLRRVLGRRLRLVFTSASQRDHTPYSRWLIGQMDALISTSSRTARYLSRPSRVIMHGIDTAAFAPTADKGAVKAGLGLEPETRYVGCYGRIRAQKGTDVFVRTMIQTLPSAPGWSAIVMGRATGKHTEFLAELKAEVATAGLDDRILFPPEVPVHEIGDWYRALDLFIAPQRWEGFGLTPIEAMAAAVPVIATDVGAFSELVPEGQTGRIIPAGDATAMARAFSAAAGDPNILSRWSAACVPWVTEHFDIVREAEAIIDVYRGLLD